MALDVNSPRVTHQGEIEPTKPERGAREAYVPPGGLQHSLWQQNPTGGPTPAPAPGARDTYRASGNAPSGAASAGSGDGTSEGYAKPSQTASQAQAGRAPQGIGQVGAPGFRAQRERIIAGPDGNIIHKHDGEREGMRKAAQAAARTDTPSVKAYRDHRAEALPRVVNDALPVYQMKNCALVAAAAVLDTSSGAVAEMVTGHRDNQSATAFGGSVGDVRGQRDGIQRFLERQFPGRLETRYKEQGRPAAEAIAAMRAFPEGTRFLVDATGHYLAGEKVGADVFFSDYQTNTAPDIPAMIAKNAIPWGWYLPGTPDVLSFWAVRPGTPAVY